ncbi:NADH-quinone oxidoreductase subunit M [Pedobacter sp. ISL-68]|uniref:complex I subunit 4 family protein n=1 Tax=unclassified Pedobacter TaxID=2628915 RepID=UPI001BEACC98|nr:MULTISPECIES: NADH-quinone oxidoreductase subunit M [unclassified Pedobacter]MBT2559914.1 NADH-quinone oxidoreductase subunit M [Pedobacter sp. ISL-64]MBT2592219.1 NADH-quinone oxidoreductase subunit M [Pedobacter sp. ISL-68]
MEQLLLLIFLPLAGAIITAFAGKSAKIVSTVFAVVSLGLALVIACNFIPNASTQFEVNLPWIADLGINFHAGIDGISMLVVLLTNLLVPIIILSSYNHEYKNPAAFYALILFMQCGLLLVFTSLDAFLFYIGWEAALIPIYFICAIWGGKDRIRINMKFFVYTIAGSLFMLMGIIYLYLQNPAHNFDIQAFYALNLDSAQQGWIFWAFFIAFAIKMPIFPFHTWQPDTYTAAPTQGTMLLSGIMLKMGIYGVIRWLLPIVPAGVHDWGQVAIILSIIGIVYASIIAFTQKDAKRLVAYSSIAHVGLISAGIFAFNQQGMQGAMVQMLSHGINVVGLFFVLDIIFSRVKTNKIEELGGIAKVAPQLALTFLIIVLGTVALPGTNGFIGEFLLLMGVYNYGIWAAAIAGLTIIFGAVYMLRMYQNVMLGETNSLTITFKDIKGTEKLVLYTICALIIVLGVYPKPILHLTEASVQHLLEQVNQKLNTVN